MKKSNWKYILIMILLIISALVILFFIMLNEEFLMNNTTQSSDLYINEIMPLNKTVIADDDNEYSDYIELYNSSDKEINLKGYFLSDEVTSSKKWEFPRVIIKPSEYLIIYISGKDKCDLTERICHTNFKLDKKGETVSLLNDKGKVISKIKYEEMTEDESYSLIENNYQITIGTPGTKNILDKIHIASDKDIIINEVTTTGTEAIELKNNTDKDISLRDYSISDKSGVIVSLKDLTIKANSYLVVYGSDTYSFTNNTLYTGFRLGNSNEIIYLYKNSKIVDEFNIGRVTNGISKGLNNENKMVLYKNITLGTSNSDSYYYGYSSVPTFSNNGGYVENGTKVKLSVDDKSTIYYTVDGTTPTTNSIKYEGEIVINSTVVIRAIAYKDGYLPSEIVSRTYFVGREHNLPVVSISTDNNNIYGSSGIFTKGPNASLSYPYYGANFWNDIEVPISFEFYEEGNLGLNFNAGMKVFGGWSRGEAQKSVAISLREEYGLEEITYPFFEDNVNTFSKFILRSGGQDFGKLKIKDAFLQESLDGQMDIDKQDYRPVVVYINGIYNGIYNIREKTDTTYVKRHYGYEKEEIDFIEGNAGVKAGDLNSYNELLNYVQNNDMTASGVYEYLSTQIDMQELANYWVVETYFDQFDPMNIKFYKAKEDGKWRWILFDLDQTFFSYTYTTIKWKLPFEPYAHGNGYYLNTTLMNRLIKNPQFRQLYIETFAHHLKTTFQPDRMIEILDKMVKEIEEEMPYHINRWYKESILTSSYTLDNMNEWYNNLNYFKQQLRTRHKVALNTVKSGLNLTNEEYNKYFGNW